MLGIPRVDLMVAFHPGAGSLLPPGVSGLSARVLVEAGQPEAGGNAATLL